MTIIIATCRKGHAYDISKYHSCPFCTASRATPRASYPHGAMVSASRKVDLTASADCAILCNMIGVVGHSKGHNGHD